MSCQTSLASDPSAPPAGRLVVCGRLSGASEHLGEGRRQCLGGLRRRRPLAVRVREQTARYCAGDVAGERRIFQARAEAYNRRDVDELLKELDPEVEWHSALLIPFGGEGTVSRGHDGVREVLREAYAALAEIHLEYSEIRDLDDRIVGIGRIRTQGKPSGVVTEMAFGTVCDMKNGNAVRIWTYLDPKEALEAAGL
jgi:ketosteroid isomerase-like protein